MQEPASGRGDNDSEGAAAPVWAGAVLPPHDEQGYREEHRVSVCPVQKC